VLKKYFEYSKSGEVFNGALTGRGAKKCGSGPERVYKVSKPVCSQDRGKTGHAAKTLTKSGNKNLKRYSKSFVSPVGWSAKDRVGESKNEVRVSARDSKKGDLAILGLHDVIRGGEIGCWAPAKR